MKEIALIEKPIEEEDVTMNHRIRVCVPELLRERGLTVQDLMYGARLSPGTAYKLAVEEDAARMRGITFDVLTKLCDFFNLGVGDVLLLEDPKDGNKAGKGA